MPESQQPAGNPGDVSDGRCPEAWCDPEAACTLQATGLLPAKSQHTALQLWHQRPLSSQDPPPAMGPPAPQMPRRHLLVISPLPGTKPPGAGSQEPGSGVCLATAHPCSARAAAGHSKHVLLPDDKRSIFVTGQHPHPLWVASPGWTSLCQRVLHRGQASTENEEEEEEVISSSQGKASLAD